MPSDLKFDWDKANVSHLARHNVTPKEAEEALRNDPVDLGYEDVNDEERWNSIGHTDNFRVLLVVWTLRGEDDVVRVVTAREAAKTAARAYLWGKGFLV